MIQPVRFRNFTDLMSFLPKQQGEIVKYLQAIILEIVPDVVERFSYNVPYYYLNRRLCFIWPSAVPWGKVQREGVLFGFCEGNLLPENDYFELENRKKVAAKTYFKVREIDEDLLRYYLFEAMEIDRTFQKKRF